MLVMHKPACAVATLGILCLLLMLTGQVIFAQAVDVKGLDVVRPVAYLPLVMYDYIPVTSRLCRFGVDASASIARYPVNQLRLGWYTNWRASLLPSRPGGVEYLQTVRLTQTGLDTYTSSPQGDGLLAIVAANPGAQWVIGNEPDRRALQDSIEPHVYAQAYHDLYFQIKGRDPTARIVAGSIVQPTPLRLQYLNLILDNYRTRYGQQMPVDVWNIHAFILSERSCTYFPEDCWGADIPPGIDAREGMLFTVDDNDNLEVFKQFIVNFRQWMAHHGYQEQPLIITEYGVMMPQDYGFPPARVNAYMNATFDYLSSAVGPTGLVADKGRLVQSWAWYSLTDSVFNGWLYDVQTGVRTVYGDNFAAYTSAVTPAVNLTPVKAWAESDKGTVKLVAQIANNGNIAMSGGTQVRFYDGDPDHDGIPIGPDQLLPAINGCAKIGQVAVTWSNPPEGTTTVWVVTDPLNTIGESDESDNRLSAQVVMSFTPVRQGP